MGKKVIIDLDLCGQALRNAVLNESTVEGVTLSDALTPTPVAEPITSVEKPTLSIGVVEWNQIVEQGVKIASIVINGVSVDVYAPSGSSFDERVRCNEGLFIDSSESTERDSGVNINYEEGGILSFSGPNDTVRLTNIRAPIAKSDVANKEYIDELYDALEQRVSQLENL